MTTIPNTLPGVDRRPLISYLRVQADFERQMLAILQSASVSIDAELRRFEARTGVGAGMRLEQLAQSQAAIHRQTAQLFGRLGNTLEASRAEAAAAAVETMHPASLLGSVFPKADQDLMLRSAQATAKRGIELAEARMNLSQIPLSARVYETERLVDGTIDRIINDAITRGASASELARDVRSYIRPDTPGGVKYAAQRLGRTELNNAFHATQVQEAIKTPWTTALRWNLSGSHPRPDECNDYAEKPHMEGGEAGLWKPEEVPGKPHPNCLCFTTPVTPDRDEFVRRFQTGEYDEYLDSELPEGLSVQSASVQNRPRATPSRTRYQDWEGDAAEIRRKSGLSEGDLARSGGGAQGDDPLLAQILERQGFDGLPAKISSEEADSLVSEEGALRLFRGLRSTDSLSATEMAEQFTDGKLFAGRGMFGNGTYASTAESYASGYARGGGQMMELVLRPGSRVVTHEELQKLMEELPPIPSNTKDPLLGLLKDPGRFAAMLGIDAVTVSGGLETLILNRTALMVVIR